MDEEENRLLLHGVRLLARREYGVAELAQRLARKFGAGSPIDKVMGQLVAQGLVDDGRYARSMLRQRQASGYGARRVRAELRERGVGSEIIEDALETSEFDWVAAASRQLKKRFGRHLTGSLDDRARAFRYLGGRGFSAEEASSAIRRREADLEEEPDSP